MKHLRKICKNGPARPGPAQLDPTRPGPARPSPDLSGSARSASSGPARPGMRPGPDRPSPAILDKISQNLTIFNDIIKMQIWELDQNTSNPIRFINEIRDFLSPSTPWLIRTISKLHKISQFHKTKISQNPTVSSMCTASNDPPLKF